MGFPYDNAYIYDWDGTYDDGPPVPIVSPTKYSAIRARYPTGAPEQSICELVPQSVTTHANDVRARFDAGAARSHDLRAKPGSATPAQSVRRLTPGEISAREHAARIHWANVYGESSFSRLALDAAAQRFSSLVRCAWSGVAGKHAATAVAIAVALAKTMPTALPWADAIAKNAFVRIRWRPGAPFRSGYTIPFGGDPDVPPGTTIIIPPAEVYFMIPALSILRTSDAADLNAIDASVKLDINSYAWTLDATIPYSSLPLVNPNARSQPEAVTVSINGYSWAFVVEGFTDNRKFGGTGCKIRGRSPAALLGAPYAPLSTFSNPLAKDASQLAADLMPTGWSLTWSTQDWLVPSHLFSYADLAPIDALAQLVNAIGGGIVPDASAQSLTVQPLYPTSPWDWSGATPYADVPSSFVAELAGQWEGNFKTDYNGIYVSGQNSGVVGLVKRTGTAGDVQLPVVTDALLCVQAANVERGRIELAKADKKKTETIRALLLPPGGSGNPGVFPVGALIQVTEPAVNTSAGAIASATWLAQVMGVQIDAVHSSTPGSALSVRQTLTVERHA